MNNLVYWPFAVENVIKRLPSKFAEDDLYLFPNVFFFKSKPFFLFSLIVSVPSIVPSYAWLRREEIHGSCHDAEDDPW